MPNWNDINRCPIWKVLGVIECNNCGGEEKCWGSEIILPETKEGITALEKVFMKENNNESI